MTYRETEITELDVHASVFTEALIRHGFAELAEDLLEWWSENRPEDLDDA